MSEKTKFFTHFNPPPSPELKCSDASLTRQEFVQESDINNIMKRYAAGMPLPSGKRLPMFDDFSHVPDFQQAFEIVQKSSELFEQLPSAVRDRFGHDPQQLLAFLNDSNNRDEAIKLGLIESPSVSVPSDKTKGGSDEPPPTTIT